MTENERQRNHCIGLLESIAMGMATMPAQRWSTCEYRDLYRQLSDIEDRVFRKGEYAPENVADTRRR
jgi:hypothetical protein